MLDHDNLEAFADAEHYDANESQTDVPFYSALAQETGGPVLELACGTGRVSIPIARLGLSVTGLDIVPGMLEQARRKSGALPIRWLEGDARTFELGERFRLIFLCGNAFQLFRTRDDQEALLERARAHLDDEGWLAFETRNPFWSSPATREAQAATIERARLRGDWFTFLEDQDNEWMETGSDGREVRMSSRLTYDHVTQILHGTTYRGWTQDDQERTPVMRLALRYTFPQELEALLHHAGFEIIRQYGDWDLQPLSAASTSIIVVCRKRA